MSISTQLTTQLLDLFGTRYETNPDVLDRHGKDESFHPTRPPDCVVYPVSNEEVSQLVKLCSESSTPIIPFGVGTSLEGNIAALHGGVCVDMSMMNQILQINDQDLDCRVQAGVLRLQLDEALASYGQFFPVDPGANATLGGMTATRASGTNAVRYGTMKDNVIGLTVVMPDGKIVQLGGRARKSAAGYDLTRLMCGSEGTLGIITEIQLKTYGRPESDAVGVCSFESLHDAVNCVIQIIQFGIPVARVELLDDVQMRAINLYSKLSYPEAHTLFFEFHGTQASVNEESKQVAEIVAEFNGSDFQWSTKQEQKTQLWKARHDAYYAARALKPGSSGWPTDVCVPISNLAQCISETREDTDKHGVLAPIVGHVGDGNFHLLLLVDQSNESELALAEAINDRLITRALSMGGTCTGEHGIGYGKLKYMAIEHSTSIYIMQKIKQALDPKNIMNPGKVIPSLSSAADAS